jgi:hypothetical protein
MQTIMVVSIIDPPIMGSGMARGALKGYVLFGQNPGGGPDAKLHRAGLRNLDWLVVLDRKEDSRLGGRGRVGEQAEV